MNARAMLDFLTHPGARPAETEDYDGRLVASRADPCGCVQETWVKRGEEYRRVTPCREHILTIGLGGHCDCA